MYYATYDSCEALACPSFTGPSCLHNSFTNGAGAEHEHNILVPIYRASVYGIGTFGIRFFRTYYQKMAFGYSVNLFCLRTLRPPGVRSSDQGSSTLPRPRTGGPQAPHGRRNTRRKWCVAQMTPARSKPTLMSRAAPERCTASSMPRTA